MPIQTRRRQVRFLRLLAIAVISLVFGVWGMYDYFIRIPGQIQLYERVQLLTACVQALERPQDPPPPINQESQTVIDRIDADLARLGIDPATAQPQALDEQQSDDARWAAMLLAHRQALLTTRRLPLSTQPPVESLYLTSKSELDRLGDPKQRGEFDRILWGLIFVPCLPFGVWILWVARQRGRRWYRLEDDGSLHMHAGEWAAEDIEDIDMSRWMSKSIAYLKHRDGQRLKLDDYYHDGLHRIVGAIAHRLHPEAWTEEAKKVKKEADPPSEPSSQEDSAA